MVRRRRAALILVLAVILGGGLGWFLHGRRKPAATAVASSGARAPQAPTLDAPTADDLSPTTVYAHNLMLRKGSQFRIYVRWIAGHMVRTHKQVNPSFDEPDSFVLEIDKGIIHANIGDISNFLNASAPKNAPLTNISLQPRGDLLALHGTVHKIVPLPVEVVGRLSPTPDGLVRFQVVKLSVLKMPMKGLFGLFHIKLSDLVHMSDMPGVQVAGNDIMFDTQKLLPPPHIRGQITSVNVKVPDLEVIYGNAPSNEASLAQWHNFIRFRGGALDFGKLTMHNADLTMIDAAQEPWFDLDLVNYQAQLVDSYTRMTAQAGLEIYMPDVKEKAPKKSDQSVTLEWLKNRNRSLPQGVPVK